MTPRNEEMKKSLIQKIFATNGWKTIKDSSYLAEIQPKPEIQSPVCSDLEHSMSYGQDLQCLRIFTGTWNVGGVSPYSSLNLDDFLQVHDQSDIYVLGFQEIVPLNAGNVLVIEDNGTAAKWLSLISQSLNKSSANKTNASSAFIQRTCLKTASKIFRAESRKRLKSCNCYQEPAKKYNIKESCFKWQQSSNLNINENDLLSIEVEEDEKLHVSSFNQMKYRLIKSKQMVGIFVTIWARKDIVPQIGHLRTSCISRGILGCLGNKGCISVSMSIYQTSFCFVCSHLASGEKEGDELRRNLDVIEIIKNTQFPKICRTPNRSRMPEKILEHDRIIWLGDLNYRIALSYSETRKLLEENQWDALLDKDQLKTEREAGRVFKGWKEGKIYFAPTYKYSYNSDNYIGDTIKKQKSKRRTPAWCDRILWHGDGIRQTSYIRWESRFSDHRPVCARFFVDV